ncbi:hypothetical protein PIB30_101165 [Stylosanthes scabra]|uniref:Uncharacterized protein n=1 Tax=Stylosanthes scabra TaxID=79078 RepID=A0ABU6VYL7_9FABA|nr:hypothetical protein [Stylosanthes scabra]
MNLREERGFLGEERERERFSRERVNCGLFGYYHHSGVVNIAKIGELNDVPTSVWYQSKVDHYLTLVKFYLVRGYGFGALLSRLARIVVRAGRSGAEGEMAPKRINTQEIEMEDLRRQVKELQEQLARYEAVRKDRDKASDDSSSSDGEDSNPFHYSSSYEELSTHKTRRNIKDKDLGIKVDIPEFEGRLQPDDFID